MRGSLRRKLQQFQSSVRKPTQQAQAWWGAYSKIKQRVYDVELQKLQTGRLK